MYQSGFKTMVIYSLKQRMQFLLPFLFCRFLIGVSSHFVRIISERRANNERTMSEQRANKLCLVPEQVYTI